MKKESFIQECNKMASRREPFLFVIDYEIDKLHIYPIDKAAEEGVLFRINNKGNFDAPIYNARAFRFDSEAISFPKYKEAFDSVLRHIFHGNSFLLNLTFPSKIHTNLGLDEMFYKSKAPYRLYFKDQFVVFSPETFVRIKEGRVFTYPMKGTIDATMPDAERKLLQNEKELWEHNTIVDLLRNDLSIVSKDVKVDRFRYVDRIRTHKKDLLQVSSEISGKLDDDWRERLGDIILSILPAGSISGAPKKKTLEIIAEAEGEKRGYFTGIFGMFDGEELDSAVMIRYVERLGNDLQFRSGGGITGHSNAKEEYNEMIQKVYVPIV